MTDTQQLITKLTDLEKFALIGYIHTSDTKMAYIASRGKKLTASPESMVVQASRWITKPECKAFIEIEQQRLNIAHSQTDTENRSKQDIAKELNILATQTSDPKLKAELLMRLADLEGMKKQETVEEEEKIKYYLPLKCTQCQLYKNAKNKIK